eukprot:Gregarina_sp_Poly_1__3766@NODE_2117_length_2658_cov_83_227711_g1365_i0_p3_GENE_NODE_2117_length_2658_cov_83_227711_g1365_i0NODE_2117_length_2658_cov_83_227711_g1365_i0_p3_ORF_typecomplete_len150_score18_21MASE2/PF05230_11/0_12_NODE_2117_length_2658_cov_83_227711_g1365_i020782527
MLPRSWGATLMATSESSTLEEASLSLIEDALLKGIWVAAVEVPPCPKLFSFIFRFSLSTIPTCEKDGRLLVAEEAECRSMRDCRGLGLSSSLGLPSRMDKRAPDFRESTLQTQTGVFSGRCASVHIAYSTHEYGIWFKGDRIDPRLYTR